MLKVEGLKANALKFLISGIIILCISFLIISCGRGPKRKANNPDKGPFAIDFSLAPADEQGAIFADSGPPSIAGKELTFEGIVKRRTSVLNGGVFAHLDDNGAVLYVKNNEPKFAIRQFVGTTSTPTSTVSMFPVSVAQAPTSTPLSCDSINPTTTECIVGSGSEFSLLSEIWTHIAGVLVNKEHTHPTSESCTKTIMAQTPHLDFYVNGEFANCATTEEKFASEPGNFTTAGRIAETAPPLDDGEITIDQRFDGAIDELRLWTVARTQNQIQACMDRELSFGDANCPLDWTILKTYWRFNEGAGHDIIDTSGNGNNGGIEIFPSVEKWDDGWVDGAPIIKK
ncbi:MAG: LamG-like jellyroll fold domain-containing protein [Candidatus Hodarchaeales archaeon]|jgi:hypothetical protein